jgi:hypothetical protein
MTKMSQIAFWEVAQIIVIGFLSDVNSRRSGIKGEAM